MLPVVELRGAIPFGMALGLPFWQVLLAALIGNILPIPFIILFIRKVFQFLRKRFAFLEKLIDKIESKAMGKAEKVQKYELIGLCIFVAIPLPGTGAWTGALIAALLDIRMRRAVPSIFIGVLIAAVIVSITSYGIASLF
ncbi:MAG: small multi-drug export protein [Clostridiales bacterium]|nr:small multi-drug export protein [Clostridiales bacterium]